MAFDLLLGSSHVHANPCQIKIGLSPAAKIAASGTLLLLAACGGGGGGGSNPPPAQPTVTLSASPTAVTAGGSTTLTWSSTNATGCTASGAWTGARGTSGSEVVSNVTAAASYSLVCAGAGGNSPASTVSITVNPPAATATLAANPTNVTVGGSTTLTWSSANATACTAGGGWTGARGTSGTEVINNITAATSYTLVCAGAGSPSPTSTVNVTVGPPPTGNATVTGKITYARVPFSTTPNGGLNYAAEFQEPSRGIVVQVVNAQSAAVLVTTSTDANGDYSAVVPAGTNVIVRAVAQMVRDTGPATWRFEVRDLPATTEVPSPLPLVYTFDSATVQALNTTTQNVAIPSGWNASGTNTGTRHAAPFAVLDTIYRSVNTILAVAPNVTFTPLIIDWGPNNTSGSTFFTVAPVTGQPNARQPKIVLSAAATADTDEYDAHVVAHEFGHYIEEYFSRADSIGGPHGPGDRLDPRVAFGEGYGYAFAAIVLNDPVARDSFTQGAVRRDSTLNVETNTTTNAGWYNEATVWAILWDLFDTTNEPGDNASLGWGPIWQVLTTAQRDTDAMTTIFSFVAALKAAQPPASAAAIDEIVGRAESAIVAPTIEPFASTETNNAGSAFVLPVYTPISIGGAAVTVTSTSIGRTASEFGTGGNKLSAARFLRLDVATAQSVRVQLTGPVGRDVDVRIYRRGVSLLAFPVGRADGNEDFRVTLQPGTHILEVFDCENAECSDPRPTGPAYVYDPTPITVTLTN